MRLHALILLAITMLVAACAATNPTRPGQVFRDCKDCPEMVVVALPAGALGPGSAPLTVAVGRYEVTRDEFDVWAKDTLEPDISCYFPLKAYFDKPIDFKRSHPGLGGFQPSGRDPAICVSWFEAQDYVEWLSRKTGHTYRLPSDAELQYLAGGGSTTRFPWGDRVNDVCIFGNVLDLSAQAQKWEMMDGWSFQWSNCTDGAAYTAPVGSFKPNALGLYDTIGNVSEWTATCEANKTLPPTRGHDCPAFVLRGGGWIDPARRDARDVLWPGEHWEWVGLRVIRVLSIQP